MAEMNPAEDHQAQRHLGEVRDSQHREVIKGVEVVRGDPSLTSFLVVEDLRNGQPEFCDHAPKVWVWVAEVGADLLDNSAIVEPKTGEVFEDFDVG